MKILFVTLLISNISFANTKSNWVPEYQQKNKIKENSVKVLKASPNKVVTSDEKKTYMPTNALDAMYLKASTSKEFLKSLKEKTLAEKQNAVPILTKVMKSSNYPDENRWIATYMLGRIMGKKAAPYIAKFSKHPNWMLRLASLKVLLHLDQKQYKGIYANLLEDKSLIVRHQALQNIKEFNLSELAPYVWKMLYNKENYLGTVGNQKRSNIIKDAIKVIGDLGFEKAKKPMLEMISRKKYKDIFSELDYSLSKITSKSSPSGDQAIKKHFWNRYKVSQL